MPWLNGKFIVNSGTSFAAAHILGLCAKMLEYNNSIASKNVHEYFEEQASVIYDYALTKYSDLLNFQLVGVFSNKYMGKMNQVEESNSKHIHMIKNVDENNWDNFDTLILGHVNEMVKILGNKQVEDLVVQCIKKLMHWN